MPPMFVARCRVPVDDRVVAKQCLGFGINWLADENISIQRNFPYGSSSQGRVFWTPGSRTSSW
jgi:hypothetical protein